SSLKEKFAEYEAFGPRILELWQAARNAFEAGDLARVANLLAELKELFKKDLNLANAMAAEAAEAGNKEAVALLAEQLERLKKIQAMFAAAVNAFRAGDREAFGALLEAIINEGKALLPLVEAIKEAI
uniref:De novo designed KABLE protein n=1 Tax=synthetic construct TaxID=32630 RepID=UPI003F8D8F9B